MTTEINTAELRKLAKTMISAVGIAVFQDAKAKYLLAASPSTMLALLDRLAMLEAEKEADAAVIQLMKQRLAASQQGSEPVAWLSHNGKRCISAEDKRKMETCNFGHWAEVAASYTTPLYTHPIAPVLSSGDAGSANTTKRKPLDAAKILSKSDGLKVLRPGTVGHTVALSAVEAAIAAAQEKDNG